MVNMMPRGERQMTLLFTQGGVIPRVAKLPSHDNDIVNYSRGRVRRKPRNPSNPTHLRLWKKVYTLV